MADKLTPEYIKACLQNAVRNHVANGHPERADDAINAAAHRFIDTHGARKCLEGTKLLAVLELWEREARR